MGLMAPAAVAQAPSQGYDESGVLGNVESGETGNPGIVEERRNDVATPPGGPAEAGAPRGERDAGAPAGVTDSGSGPGAPGGGEEAGSGSGTLPFSGLDLAVIALMGGLLLATGLLLRRVRHRDVRG